MAQTVLLPKYEPLEAVYRPSDKETSLLKRVLYPVLYVLLGAALAMLITDTRFQDLIRTAPIPYVRPGGLNANAGKSGSIGSAFYKTTTAAPPGELAPGSPAQAYELGARQRGNLSAVFSLPPERTEHIRYLRRERLVVAVTAKGGSTTVWKWLFTGVTGKRDFNCSSYVQNVHATCWNGLAREMHELSAAERRYALTSPDVLRVAIWRDPFSRLVSCWKSKFACEAWKYGTDYSDRARMVPQLLSSAGLPLNVTAAAAADDAAAVAAADDDGSGGGEKKKGKKKRMVRSRPIECLNITEYAETLEATRKRMTRGEVRIEELNPHLRPQEFFFDAIKYDLVVDVGELSVASKVAAIWQRLRHRDMVGKGMEALHVSSGERIEMGERTAELIARFAGLTKKSPGQ